ncbi:MAG: glycosyl transferase family 1 [Phycisphaeraceae bacterium]|nr:glycosyl transferase family 1 [Phycisphaeraceae bacterium]
MKILHIITRLILGGAQQNTILSCRAQVEAGHEVLLAYGPIYGPEGSLLNDAQNCGAQLIEVRSLRRAVLPGHDLHCYGSLRALIRKFNPDVVHTHSSKAGIVGRAAGWHCSVPAIIHTIHGLPFHERQSSFERNLYIAVERWAAQRCHCLIGVTEAMTRAFEENDIGSGQRFEVVPSGIELSRFSQSHELRASTRRAYRIAPDAQVIGIVARLDRFKGHDDLLDILPALVARVPSLRVMFVGDGYHRKALECRVEQQKMQSRVVFAGLVPFNQVPSLYQAMDVMVLPSYQEGQPRTMLEALLSGCGIVGYDSGGVGAICVDGKTGRLVPTGDTEALADAILWMLENSGQRALLTQAGFFHAQQNFGVQVMSNRLEKIYNDVLGR